MGNGFLPFQEWEGSDNLWCGFADPKLPLSHYLVTEFPNIPWSNSISHLKSQRDAVSPGFSFENYLLETNT